MTNLVTVGLLCNISVGGAYPEKPEISLTSPDQYVVWWCINPPPLGSLAVRFSGSDTGPFAELRPDGEYWIGSGNRGSQAVNDYTYDFVVTSPDGYFSGYGVIHNLVKEALLNVPPLVCVPGSRPPRFANGR